jgi:ATP synthase protein I
MAGNQIPKPSPDDDAASGASKGWTAMSYIIGGMTVWGLVGWAVDRWLDTNHIATAIGIVLGMAGGIYLTARRVGGV